MIHEKLTSRNCPYPMECCSFSRGEACRTCQRSKVPPLRWQQPMIECSKCHHAEIFNRMLWPAHVQYLAWLSVSASSSACGIFSCCHAFVTQISESGTATNMGSSRLLPYICRHSGAYYRLQVRILLACSCTCCSVSQSHHWHAHVVLETTSQWEYMYPRYWYSDGCVKHGR